MVRICQQFVAVNILWEGGVIYGGPVLWFLVFQGGHSLLFLAVWGGGGLGCREQVDCTAMEKQIRESERRTEWRTGDMDG